MEKKEFLKKIVFSGITLLIILLIGYLLFSNLGITNINQKELQNFIESTGVIAPLVYILITFLQVNLLPIPSAVTIIAGSYLFGPFLSFVYAYIGLMIGSLLSYWLGKIFGRPFVNWLSGSKEKTDEWVSKLKGRENILLFLMFLFPMFPDDILCAIAGILPITFKNFFIMQIITRFTTVTTTLIFMSGDIIPFNMWGITIISISFIICFSLLIYCFKNYDKLDYKLKLLKRKLIKRSNSNKMKNEENDIHF